MSQQLEQLRNIGIIAHIDAGKTTVTERMLFYSGAKHRPGSVDHGTTETDDNEEEQNRGITIYSACVAFSWKSINVNLIDTPGHVDFTAEVERCLRVLDGAVVVFSAREGVEAQSETVWRQADRYRVPRVAFINKMDREGADFENVFDQLEDRLNANPVPIQIPVGQGPAHVDNPFSGIVDLVRMKYLAFDAESQGREFTVSEIPAAHSGLAELWRERMLETLYKYSDEMMELGLEEREIPAELILRVLRAATVEQQIQPVLCGSALHGIGVQPVLDAVGEFLPSPLDRPPVEGTHPTKGNAERRGTSAEEPFAGLVFKVVPAKTGDMSWVRVYSGELKANSRVYNPGRDKKDNASQLWQIHVSKKEHQIPIVRAGDIVGVIGLRHSITGDTLCDAKSPILLESIDFPDTVLSMAIEPESTAERQKLADALEMLKRQDPTLRIVSGETGQTLMQGMGELHLEVVKNKLLRDFSLNVKFHQPQVSYRETVGSKVEVIGECHRQIAGKQLFAELSLRMERFEAGEAPVTVVSTCSPEELSPALLQAAIGALRDCGEGGGLIGSFPLSKIKVTVLGGKMADEGSDEMAFRIAANDGFEKALRKGVPVLLEPVMKLDITTPEKYLGDFVGDLQQRRAIIAKTENRGSITTIEAHVPLKELFGYSGAMRSLSQGRAGCSMEPLHYAAAPPEDAAEFQFE